MFKTLRSVSVCFEAVDHKRLPGSSRKKKKSEYKRIKENLFKIPAGSEQQEELLYQGVP